jgi:hypothetical protein
MFFSVLLNLSVLILQHNIEKYFIKTEKKTKFPILDVNNYFFWLLDDILFSMDFYLYKFR